MWDNVVNIVTSAISSCFSWFSRFMSSLPGAWDTIFTIIVILLISRFLLGPLLGAAFGRGSDKARKSAANKKE